VISRMPIMLATIAFCALAPLGWPAESGLSEPAKFEPPDHETILIIGQTREEFGDYANTARAGQPGGYMFYTSLKHLEGLTSPWKGAGCTDAGVEDLQDWVNKYPESVGQVGLYIVDQLSSINSGALDANIKTLAETLRKTNKPILMRIGYEFDGEWNAYEPEAYVAAWRRIVDIFRGKKVGEESIVPVTNVAFVWHSAVWKTFHNHPISAWYPGDNYVDWAAISWFAWSDTESRNVSETARSKLAAFAKEHNKPLMIAESAPKSYYAPARSDSWSGWFEPLFAWIRRNNVKAFSYINQNWDAQPMWHDPSCKNPTDWGDTRVQAPDSTVLKAWQETVRDRRFLGAGPQLYKAIRFPK
jgi:Glycosyl hydrolase family 26